MSLHLLQLRVRPEGLIRYAQRLGVNSRLDGDLGYACHAWLSGLFRTLAPAPFRLLDAIHQQRTQGCRLLAYTEHEAAVLLEQANLYADVNAYATLEPGAESILTRPLPGTWQVGQRLGFELLACPVSRKDKHEKDIFLRRLDQVGPEVIVDRAAVYREWLDRQLAGAARLEACDLTRFQRVKLLRREQAKTPEAPRTPRGVERPSVAFVGELVVTDPAAFAALLARGVGRHRAFGFGMLLLRPPR